MFAAIIKTRRHNNSAWDNGFASYCHWTIDIHSNSLVPIRINHKSDDRANNVGLTQLFRACRFRCFMRLLAVSSCQRARDICSFSLAAWRLKHTNKQQPTPTVCVRKKKYCLCKSVIKHGNFVRNEVVVQLYFICYFSSASISFNFIQRWALLRVLTCMCEFELLGCPLGR